MKIVFIFLVFICAGHTASATDCYSARLPTSALGGALEKELGARIDQGFEGGNYFAVYQEVECSFKSEGIPPAMWDSSSVIMGRASCYYRDAYHSVYGNFEISGKNTYWGFGSCELEAIKVDSNLGQ